MKNFHWRDAVIYQIYPRSFQDTNQDGVGDLKGIIKRLDYFKGGKNSLDVDAIWISPFYPSPMIDGGYDISDYCNIDPVFGTLENFDLLIKKAHERDLKIIIDYIPNHTSDQHPWFKESRSNRNNPKRDWYIWKDPKSDGSAPNNWMSVFGGSAWKLDAATGQYYLHSFAIEQPDLNWENPEVKKAMFDVLRFWFGRGVDGVRVDAFNQVLKDYSFPDEPENPSYIEGKGDPYRKLLHVYAKDVAGKLPLLKELCNVVDEFDHKLIVTEAYLELDDLLHYYKIGEKETLSPFNFSMLLKPWDASLYRDLLAAYEKGRGPHDIGNFVLSNHDNPRVVKRIGRDQARIAAVLLMTLRGIPFIYYGDELGMTDGEIPLEKMQDPRAHYNASQKLSRDPARTPMQWDSNRNAGFSSVEPWLPLPQDYVTYNVENEQKDSESFLSLYKRLIRLRKRSTVLRRGKYIAHDLQEKDILAFTRSFGKKKILVVLNFSAESKKVSLPLEKGTIEIHVKGGHEGKTIQNVIEIEGVDAYVIQIS